MPAAEQGERFKSDVILAKAPNHTDVTHTKKKVILRIKRLKYSIWKSMNYARAQILMLSSISKNIHPHIQ